MKNTARILAALLAALVAALPAAADGTDDDLFGARYFFEHRMLPEIFYEVPEDLARSFSEGGVYPLWKAFCDRNGIGTFYGEADFSVTEVKREGEAFLLRVGMPIPEKQPLCWRIYLYYDGASGTGLYLTLERDDFAEQLGMDAVAYLCAWKPDGAHANYGALPLTDGIPDDEAGTVWDTAVKDPAPLAAFTAEP